MADTLAQLIDKVQSTLFDEGTLFPDANVTAAVRLALQDINRQCPQHAATTIAAVAAQLDYELNDADPAAAGITDVLLEGQNDADTALLFSGFEEDGRWFFRLAQAQAAGATLRVHYIIPHTIAGLDGAGDSTLTDELNAAAVAGSAYYATLTRAARAVEANNVNPTWRAPGRASQRPGRSGSTRRCHGRVAIRRDAAMAPGLPGTTRGTRSDTHDPAPFICSKGWCGVTPHRSFDQKEGAG